MEKAEWPTKARLDDLRKRGIVSYSVLAARLLAAAVLLAMLPMSIDTGAKLVQALQLAVTHPTGRTVYDLVSAAWEVLRTAVVAPLIVIVPVIFLFGLLQTRFHFRSANISFLPGRLIKLQCFKPKVVIGSLISSIFLLAGVVTLGVLVLYLGVSAVGVVLNHDRHYLLRWAESVVRGRVFLVTALLLTLALCSLLGARIAFMIRHRMSSQEVEKEMTASE